MDSKKRSKSGSHAANIGIANEHIALGILMQKYNASKVDLPSSKFDIILLHKKKYIRIQSKTAHPSIGFKGNQRAGGANRGASDPSFAFRYDRTHCDILMGVKSNFDEHTKLTSVDLYFLPTILVEKIKTGSRDLSKIDILDKMTDHDRWLIASEGRKQQGLWLILTNSQKNK